jgi:perosamine synthetase
MYKKLLEKGKLNFTTNIENKFTTNSFWMTNIVFDSGVKVNTKNLIRYLNQNKVEARPFFPPLSDMKIFKSTKKNINSKLLFKNSINLPCPLNISKKEIEYVVKMIIQFIKKKNKL